MTINVNSITDSYNAWKNYYYGENTQKIKPDEIAQIEEKWSSELGKWKIRAASHDENEYEITDDERSDAKNDGKDMAEDETGVKSDSWKKNIISNGTTAAASVVGAVAATKVGVQGVCSNVTGQTVAKYGEGGAIQKSANKVSAYVAAGIAIANAALYWIRKPNEAEVEACDTLKNEILPEAQSNLQEANAEMSEASAESADLTEEANEMNEETNEEIAEQKTQFDMFRQSLLALSEKVKSGEELTPSEKALYNELAPTLEKIGVNINELSEDNTDAVNSIYGEIEEKQEIFDMAAEVVAETDGITDYAQELDRATRATCTVEMISQGLNAATGASAGIRLITTAGLNFAQYALGAAAIAAGVSSGLAVNQQRIYLADVGEEVDIRKMTQDMGEDVSDAYDEQIDIYADNLGVVEDLEMEIPEDLEVPQAETTSVNGTTSDTGILQTQNTEAQEDSNSQKKKPENNL